jgi:hypothetical protein
MADTTLLFDNPHYRISLFLTSCRVVVKYRCFSENRCHHLKLNVTFKLSLCLIKHYAKQVCAWRYRSIHSYPQQCEKVSGQISPLPLHPKGKNLDIF